MHKQVSTNTRIPLHIVIFFFFFLIFALVDKDLGHYQRTFISGGPGTSLLVLVLVLLFFEGSCSLNLVHCEYPMWYHD